MAQDNKTDKCSEPVSVTQLLTPPNAPMEASIKSPLIFDATFFPKWTWWSSEEDILFAKSKLSWMLPDSRFLAGYGRPRQNYVLILEHAMHIVAFVSCESLFAMLSERSDWEEAGKASERLWMGHVIHYDPYPDDDDTSISSSDLEIEEEPRV